MKTIINKMKSKWIASTPFVDTYECDNCGYNVPTEEFTTPYCPMCGLQKENYWGKEDDNMAEFIQSEVQVVEPNEKIDLEFPEKCVEINFNSYHIPSTWIVNIYKDKSWNAKRIE